MKNITKAEFEQMTEVGDPFLVDVYATWCAPCKHLMPTLEHLSENELKDIPVVKVDVDQEKELAKSFGVKTIPTLILFHWGREVGRISGKIRRDQVMALVRDSGISLDS